MIRDAGLLSHKTSRVFFNDRHKLPKLLTDQNLRLSRLWDEEAAAALRAAVAQGLKHKLSKCQKITGIRNALGSLQNGEKWVWKIQMALEMTWMLPNGPEMLWEASRAFLSFRCFKVSGF